MHIDLYRELTNKVGAGNSSIIREIWASVCTPEEAVLLNVLPATADELVQRLGKAREEIESLLKVLFHKGLVFEATKEGKTIYRLPRHIIQFHDASTLWAERPPVLLDLWKKYMEEEYPQIPAALKAMKSPPFFRVVPINENIESKNKVLAYEDAAQIVDKAATLAVANCPCRMIMRKCDKPLEVCLQINKGAEYAIKRGTGRKIDAAEAKKILRRAEEAGLVHLTENKASLGTVICNCCSCCCIGLPFMKDPATSSLLVPSRYQALVDGEACTGCGNCVSDCPMDAISLNEANVAEVNDAACIGCGVCTHVCPVDAIVLRVVRQEDFIPS
ncbi:MAG TPA: 4Fe-4S binding protein [Syntrophales bacterium]|nr:4Fe-4S binding protein [Syntrophales bacterium]